jgi:hypothetical protein
MNSEPMRSVGPKQDTTAMVLTMVEMWQSLAHHSADIPHYRHTFFLAYLHEGFNETQALELIKI